MAAAAQSVSEKHDQLSLRSMTSSSADHVKALEASSECGRRVTIEGLNSRVVRVMVETGPRRRTSVGGYALEGSGSEEEEARPIPAPTASRGCYSEKGSEATTECEKDQEFAFSFYEPPEV